MVEDFQQFLKLEQREIFADDAQQVRDHMLSFIDDRMREARGLYFSPGEVGKSYINDSTKGRAAVEVYRLT